MCVSFLFGIPGDLTADQQPSEWRAALVRVGKARSRGTGQGSVISPLLANIYMHYVFDLWPNRWRQREAQGDMVIVRYADDFVVGFEYESDARRFWDALRVRLEEFALTLHSVP